MLEWFADISAGIQNVFTLQIFLAALVGVSIGVIIGILPGLGPPVAISLAIPLTFSLAPQVGMAVMLGIYKGGTYGGSISAILINTPGTPAASATVMDGYPMTLQGKAGKALDISLYGSVFGDAFSIFLLCIIAQPIASVASKFGPTEIFSLLVFALTIIASLAGKSLAKGIIAALFGIIASIIGMDPVEGLPRLSFDTLYLESGLSVIAITVGLFAFSELMTQSAGQQQHDFSIQDITEKKKENSFATLADLKRCFPFYLLGSGVGASIGALPGTGAATAAFVSYGLAKKRSKYPEEFGKGSVDGIAAAEAGHNAVIGGALIPMLTLGIPGDVVTAVLMGALMIHGINAGPSIFTEHREFVFTLFGMLLVSILMLLIVGKLACKVCRKITDLPTYYISPIVVLLCVSGTFAVNMLISDVWTMFVFGIIGFIFIKMGMPLAPLIIGFILAPKLEQSLRQSLLISNGDFSVLYTSPISCFFLAVALLSVVKIAYSKFKEYKG